MDKTNITRDLIDTKITEFEDTYKQSEAVLKQLFENPSHRDLVAVYCRVQPARW